MVWFNNLKIKSKLLLSFMVIAALVLFLSVLSITTLRRADSDYSYLLDYPSKRLISLDKINLKISEIRRLTTLISANVGNAAAINSANDRIEEMLKDVDSYFVEYTNSINSDPLIKDQEKRERIDKINEFKDVVASYREGILNENLKAALANNNVEIAQILASAPVVTSKMEEISAELQLSAEELVEEISFQSTESAERAVYHLVGIAAVISVISILMPFFVASVIAKPIICLVEVANSVAKGEFNVNINSSSKDETGMLARSFSAVVANVNNMSTDVEDMYRKHDLGNMSDRIETDKYHGHYKSVVKGVNLMVDSYIDMINDIFRALKAFSKGEFEIDMKLYEGEKHIVNTQIKDFQDIITDIVDEIESVARAGANGDLSKRADARRFTGSWKVILHRMNNVLDAVIGPISEAQLIMTEMSKGNFDAVVTGDYKGEFAKIKNALNGTVDSIASYIKEISEILGLIANGDLRRTIEREYIGQFSYIKDSINAITDALNNTLFEIINASDQVLAGSKQISDSAMDLADGATNQASSIQELNASVEMINNQTQANAANAGNANSLSSMSTQNAQDGNNEMKKMLIAMEDMKTSSQNISKIIKTIQDIAFQTNMLALNAAVEAARAGEHGKGFAVVAEEVRSLASRSQKAAIETTSLIEDSINKVNEGTRIAEATANALDVIVENANQVSDFISQISDSSINQAEAVSQVSVGLEQISGVIQKNSSTSEESAAAAEELSSQAENLKKMVSFFKLR